MAVRTSFTSGEVLAAADLTDTFGAKANTSALTSKADLASPTFTGTPAAPTAAVATNTTQIATTAFVLANSAAGLVHINTTTFSAVSSVSLNSVFTSTYDHYKALMQVTGSTSQVDLLVRLRASGSDNSTTNYNSNRLKVDNTVVAGDRLTSQAQARAGIAINSNADFEITFYNPQLSTATGIGSINIGSQGGDVQTFTVSNGFFAGTSFDGFTIYPSSGTITGTIRVYGYKNS